VDKVAKLLDLARVRQSSRWPGYKPLIEYHQGAYECDFVSPYTKSAGNVNADVMIVLQDWSSDERLSRELDPEAAELGHMPGLPTNRNLIRLLKTHFNLELGNTYGTNLFPFIKAGGLSSGIPVRDLERAASEFAVPQIEIIEPRLVVCLGLQTFNALRVALGKERLKSVAAAIESPMSLGRPRIWCQAHTGALGQNNRNRGGVERVTRDWEAMRHDTAS
jgi:uracil-DNA glycosylase